MYMENTTEKLVLQTPEEAKAIKEAHLSELKQLSLKYNLSVEELVQAANNDEIDNNEDLFLIFKRSYLLSEQ